MVAAATGRKDGCLAEKNVAGDSRARRGQSADSVTAAVACPSSSAGRILESDVLSSRALAMDTQSSYLCRATLL
ncbi:hypothetical protein J6590_030483 [Homalodisca vitripennis]|nr:hypothetical protein J6590_030483 [Homalodisca vitripennis]